MPYKIPAVAHDHEIGTIPLLRGFCVYMPDDAEFIANFVGAYTFFTKWVAYERDDGKTGKKAADMMWAAYEKTMESFYDSGCGDNMTFDCEEMKDCLIEIAKAVSVNVTVNNSCSSGGAGSTTMYCVDDDGTVTINPPPVTDYPIEPEVPAPDGWEETDTGQEPGVGDPPVGWETWEAYDADACKAANATVEYSYQLARRLEDFFTQDAYTMAAIVVVLANVILSQGLTVLFDRALIIKIAEVNGRLWFLEPIGQLYEALADGIAANRQDLVCELYKKRTNAADWQNLLIARYLDMSADSLEDENNYSLWQEVLKWGLPNNVAVNFLLGVTAPQNEDNSVSCAECEDDPPEPPAGFEFIPAVLENLLPKAGTEHVNTSHGSQSGSVVTLTLSQTGEGYYGVEGVVNWIPATVEGKYYYGLLFEVVGGSVPYSNILYNAQILYAPPSQFVAFRFPFPPSVPELDAVLTEAGTTIHSLTELDYSQKLEWFYHPMDNPVGTVMVRAWYIFGVPF